MSSGQIEERPVRVGAKVRVLCGLGLMLAAPMMAMGPARAADDGSATTVDLPPVDVL